MKKSKVGILMFFAAFVLLSLNPEAAIAQKGNDRREKVRKQPTKTQVVVKKPRNTPTRVVTTSSSRSKVTTVPRNARLIRYGSVDYRYSNGAFYKPYNNGFVATRPPIGIRLTVLPLNFIKIGVGNRRYYYYDGIYYNSVANDTYEVVDAPIGARIIQLPPYSERVSIEGQEYYISEGVYYKIVQERDGYLAYEVVGYA